MIGTLLQHIDRLILQRPQSQEALRSYRELVGLMDGIEPEVQATQALEEIDDLKNKEGFPLFSRSELPVDFEKSSKLLLGFFEHLSRSKRKDKEGLKKAWARARKDPRWSYRILEATLGKDEVALTKVGDEADLDPRTLEFLARVALRPSLYAIRDVFRDRLGKRGWDFGHCPLCGSEPDMAYFDKSGRRFLHCELCGEEWLFPRLKCPFCQNQDHDKLGYFHAEEEEGFRVDFCRKCLKYIKTLDKRVFEDPAPIELEALATLHLDLLATQQGFR